MIYLLFNRLVCYRSLEHTHPRSFPLHSLTRMRLILELTQGGTTITTTAITAAAAAATTTAASVAAITAATIIAATSWRRRPPVRARSPWEAGWPMGQGGRGHGRVAADRVLCFVQRASG